MQTTKGALMDGFIFNEETRTFVFKFGDKDEYELVFEPLLFDQQMYVALYKNTVLLTNKVVVRPGKELL